MNCRSSSDEQAATWRFSEGPYKSHCEGEPERVCSEKIASCIAILLRQRSWRVKLTIILYILAEYLHPTPAKYSQQKFHSCWLIKNITCNEKLTLYSKLKSYWKSSNLEISLEILKNSKFYKFQNLVDGFAWLLTPHLNQWSNARSVHYCG